MASRPIQPFISPTSIKSIPEISGTFVVKVNPCPLNCSAAAKQLNRVRKSNFFISVEKKQIILQSHIETFVLQPDQKIFYSVPVNWDQNSFVWFDTLIRSNLFFVTCSRRSNLFFVICSRRSHLFFVICSRRSNLFFVTCSRNSFLEYYLSYFRFISLDLSKVLLKAISNLKAIYHSNRI